MSALAGEPKTGGVQTPPKTIHEKIAFDNQYAPRDGSGYTSSWYKMFHYKGYSGEETFIVLYLEPSTGENSSPKGNVIAAYQIEEGRVILINHFNFEYTQKQIKYFNTVYDRINFERTSAQLN